MRKVIGLVVTLLAVYTLNFFLFHMLPGDPAYALVGPRMPADQVAVIHEMLGLDKPLYVQYFISLKLLLVDGYLGESWVFDKEVLDIVLDKMQYTLLLVGVGTALTVFVGVNLGIIAGSRRGRPVDVAVVGSSLAFYAMPAFWLAMIMIMGFSASLHWFPLEGMESDIGREKPLGERVPDILWHMVLPVTVFVLVSISEFVMMMRNALVDSLTEDYVTTARAKGLTPKDIVRKHAVPNALIPTVATTAMFIGWVVTGTIMIEIVFNWPGIGTLTLSALNNQDYPLLQGLFLVVTLTMLLANFGADIVYTYIDPRVRI
ncbi:MAG TPA: ABC transporter permease [Thermoplasmata archaeon]